MEWCRLVGSSLLEATLIPVLQSILLQKKATTFGGGLPDYKAGRDAGYARIFSWSERGFVFYHPMGWFE